MVHSRLTKYLTKHSILSNNRFVFRNNHDTSMAAIDKITAATDAGHYILSWDFYLFIEGI